MRAHKDMMKSNRIQNLIYVVVFLAIVVAPMFVWGILNKIDSTHTGIMNTIDFNLNEKRNKATMSEPIDVSKVTYELENYYNDRVPFRSVLITMKRNADAALEAPYKNGIEKSLLKTFSKKIERKSVEQVVEVDGKRVKCMDDQVDIFYNHALTKKEVDPYDDTIEFPLKYLNDSKVIQGQSDWLFLGELNIPYYTGEKTFKSEKEIKEYIKPYQKLKQRCDKVNKNLVIMVCPEKEEIYPEYMPTLEIKDEVERPIKLRDYIAKNTDLKYIYPKEELLKYKKNYLLYRKYDTHWNPVGAYIASNLIKEALGVETIPLRKLKLEKVDILDADLAYYANTSIDNLPWTFTYKFTDYKLNHHPDKIFVNDPVLNDSYTIHCKEGVDRKVFLIGDSFREATEEFLDKDFQEFYCNVYLNMGKEYIAEEIKRADDIVILIVERNEEILLPQICQYLYDVLGEYENEIREFLKKNSPKS